ncbi:hypothetical protein LCGC14_1641800 [marine sediment metagenome]|uniref:Uncharacterized protein n=1 Tax=marine sediment metagenome TaxID=412755 RepID=A0A0F9I026_9ZZZZ
MSEQTYPTRCRIIDVDGGIWHGIGMRTPDESRPHIGKEGTATLDGQGGVRVTLDDGSVLMGEECWWEPITS